MTRFRLDYGRFELAGFVDGCRPSSRGPGDSVHTMVSSDPKHERPDVMTLCSIALNEARNALFPDTGSISTDNMRSRLSAWRIYPQLQNRYLNTVDVDEFKMMNHILVHEVCIVLENFLSSTHRVTGSSLTPGKHTVESPPPGTKSVIWTQAKLGLSWISSTVRQRMKPWYWRARSNAFTVRLESCREIAENVGVEAPERNAGRWHPRKFITSID